MYVNKRHHYVRPLTWLVLMTCWWCVCEYAMYHVMCLGGDKSYKQDHDVILVHLMVWSHDTWQGYNSKNMSPIVRNRERLIAYKSTSHPSNINIWPPTGLWLFPLKWLGLDKSKLLKTNFNVKSPRKGNLQVAYYFVGWIRGTSYAKNCLSLTN